MTNNYIAYHVHTEQSLLDSCTNYKDYVDKCVQLGQKAIAFTEHGNTYTWIEKKMYCDEHDVKYIHGVEVYLTERLVDDEGNKIRDNYHTILLAKNYEGVKEINRLCYIASQPDHFYYKPRLSFEEFLNISNNVIKISACLASPLNKFRKECMGLTTSPFHPLLLAYDYLEIQPHNFDEQKEYNKFLYDMSNKFNIPLIVGTDTHSINQYKAECRTILQYAKKIDFGDEDTFDLTYKTYDELCEAFREQNCLDEKVWIGALNNTNIMADSIESFDLDTSFKYPILYGEDDEKVLLERLREKYIEKVQNGVIDPKNAEEYGRRIKEELSVFHKVGMSGFILFMSEMISWCWENNIPVGTGRGSCCGSTVAYISDITDVDPIVWDTIFSRFCNEHRVEIGDIDCDFCPDQRDKVYQYIIDRFGVENTGYILASGTVSSKGTIDEIGRALSFKHEKEGGNESESPYPLSLVTQIKREFEQDEETTRKKYPDLFYYYDGVLNTVVSQSQHPAGMVASPINLIDNYGGFINADGQVVLPINMEEVHEVNLVKYDILGLQNIQTIRDACTYANIPYPKSHEVNWGDMNVWNDMITTPIGLFQFESQFAFESLKKFKPTMLNHMSLVNASIRPSGESYRDRLLNHESNTNPSEQIDELLKDNNGFLVFQEDVIKFLQDICGLSGSDADNVRRAIGRKQLDRLEAAMPSILEGYCAKSDKPRDIAEEEAKTFLKIIEDASSYMFGYNHSTAYSMIGYMCAMLRYYYPLEFITSFLNNARGDEDTLNGTKLARAKGIKIKAPKFGYAQNDYICDKSTNTIYKGLRSIKGFQNVGADILQEISARNPQTFLDVLQLIDEVKIDNKKLNKKSLEILIKIGFFDKFGTIHELLATQHWYDKFGKKKNIKKDGLEDWLCDIVSNHCEKETEKTFTKVNGMGVVAEIIFKLPKEKEDVLKLIKSQIELLSYTDVEGFDIQPNVYLIQSTHQDKWGRTWATLFQLATGESKEYEVDKTFAKSHKVVVNDVVKCVFGTKPKYTKVDDKSSTLWVKTNELKTFIKFYSIVKE